MTEHSPLGASSAERWMNCPGSNAFLEFIGDTTETEEPDYRREGTAAHHAAAHCLANKLEAWEVVGQTFGDGVEFTAGMAEAVQVYLDEVNPIMEQGESFIEYRISSPANPLFFGTLDFGNVTGLTMFIRDYKHGEGLAVEVEENPQFLYYAYGLLEQHPEVQTINIGVVQPRIPWHPDGTVRHWEISADYLRLWAETILLPAMTRAEIDHTLKAGDWCRFCPAKLACPLVSGLFRAAALADPATARHMTDERLAEEYKLIKGAKFYLAAVEKETFARLNAGRDIPGTKLVYQKANRVYKPGAEVVFKNRFGQDCYTKPEFKTPAQMEQLSAAAKELVHEYAYTPQTGLTVALDSDPRTRVKVTTLAEAFSNSEVLNDARTPEEPS